MLKLLRDESQIIAVWLTASLFLAFGAGWFAAAAANLHPDHRVRFDELTGLEHPRVDAESPVRHGGTPEHTVS